MAKENFMKEERLYDVSKCFIAKFWHLCLSVVESESVPPVSLYLKAVNSLWYQQKEALEVTLG